MSLNRVAIAALLVGAAGLAGCTHAAGALGLKSNAPDEFRTVAIAPLTVPPDYSLRPPAPGEPRPQELQPESAARVALLGARDAEARSDGEKLLVAKAGGDKADPLAPYVVDDQFGDLAHKDKGFADTVMFWHKDKSTDPAVAKIAAASNVAEPIDPATEQKQIKKLTGDQPVVIQRDKRGGFIKLPGL
ncbi:MAG: DUF3035 domain-containing protein [Caulobacteraceae bacterium]